MGTSTVRILGPDGRPFAGRAARVRARYDAAQTTDDNRRHWAMADGLSARAANSPDVRRKLRERARYEAANNSYCRGIVETLANDLVGTGPRLQLRGTSADENARVSAMWDQWAAACGLAEKLRTMRKARAVDGEAFALLITNPRLVGTDVQLDLRLVEADQVATPDLFLFDPQAVDGIRFDQWGNPVEYHVLRSHPGEWLMYGTGMEYDRVPASGVLHWFRADRPGQVRGVPDITPAIPLFAQLRRYTLAVIAAAETAADFAAVLYSELPPDGESVDADPFETLEIEKRMMTTLPAGWKLAQLKAEQPATTYEMFKREILNEIARCLNVPYNVAAGNSSAYNYASGRLDYQTYYRSLAVDQYHLETAVLDRIFRAWLEEAYLAGLVDAPPDREAGWPHQWFWDGPEHVDPEKEANAQATRLANHTTTLADEWARRGHDWRERLRQRSEEVQLMAELGLTPAEVLPAATSDEDTDSGGVREETAMGTMRLKANAPAPTVIRAEGTVTIEAAKGDGKRPTFQIIGYTGAPMLIDGFYSPVIVDLTGLKAARERIPILLDHDSSRIIGQGTATIDSGGVRISGTITGEDDDAAKVITHARNGFEWQASIGASIVRQEFLKAGEKAVVNGREVTGPMLIAREARLQETSFVAIGADSQTSAAVAASNPKASITPETTMFDQWLQAQGFDPTALNDIQKKALKVAYDAENKTAAVPPTGNTVSAMNAFEETMAKVRAEEDRKAKITQVAAQYLADRPALADEIERMTKAAIEAGVTPTEFELQLLRAMRTTVGIVCGKDTRASVKVIEAALCTAGGLHNIEKHFDAPTLEAAHQRYPHGLGLRDVLVMAARENGYTGPTSTDVRAILEHAFARDIRASGVSTMSLSGILGNTANKFLLMGFNAVESTWREIAAIRSVRDFKQITSYRLTGGFTYDKVGPAGELKHATIDEMSYTNQAETYGKMFAITRTAIINDDLGALTDVPIKLGRGAALKLNNVFWATFMNNSTFFTVARGNAIEGVTVGVNDSRLNIEGLTRAETAFFNLTDPDGDPVAVQPTLLLVPNALNATAASLMASIEYRDTTANTVFGVANPHAGKYRVVRSSYLSNPAYTGHSSTAWYILANPAELAVIEVAFLNGRQEPVVESADADFNVLGIQMRGYHDFGVSLQEYRAGVRAKGAA